jgi:hypothetical protein
MLHRRSDDADTALKATVCDLIGLALAPATKAARVRVSEYQSVGAPPLL